MKGYIYNKRGILQKIKELVGEQGDYQSVVGFMKHYAIGVLDMYKIKSTVQGKSIYSSYYRLCVEAGVREDEHCPDEALLGHALSLLSFINSANFLISLLGVKKGHMSSKKGTFFQLTLGHRERDNTFKY